MKKILICTPTMATVPVEFLRSVMNLKKIEETNFLMTRDTLVYSARNTMALTASLREYDYLLWLDSDMEFEPDLLERLYAEMEEEKLDVLSGLYFKRTKPTAPVILEHLDWRVNKDGEVEREAEEYKFYPRDRLFEVAGAGTGCMLTRVSIYKEVMKKFGITPFQPLPNLGEDYSFCWRLGQLGIKIHCDSRIKLGHVGSWVYDEAMYRSQTE